ncbi:tetratricopeptide repeat protein [Planctellipticum variicoloris]|uniref:tetratricopeptide repeat protein n=1 Tax=Planctellipticum variicoloris TaxID=3064265 RepID=UPI003013EB5A|nr:tetratricopeptide repeat protein [Planctomycetaceae bacterium SH412]
MSTRPATVASEQPGHPDAHRWMGAIAYDLGDMNRALDELSIVSRLAPTDDRPYVLKAQRHADFEQFRDAVEAGSQALALHPPEPVREDVATELVRARMRIRDYAAALKTLPQARRSALSLALEAECHLSLGDAVSANARLEEARSLDPEEPSVLRLFGRMELDAGRPEAALEPLRSVLKLDPQDHESRHHLAQALRLLGRTAEADAEARRSANIVKLKLEMANLNIEAINRPQDADVRDRIAAVCSKLGKPQLAESWRKAAAACRQRSRGAETPSTHLESVPPK